ncbi:NUDIX domain-containing protein [Histidinibacterium lentulum]|uniref:NUDIX domain-containing protein n=1 Tax=Histidinibacterium lentulum TaxID=2480588 RepID=UPI000F4C0CCA|nr:NUDIX domain-containing protein [Histidinibacterium lentulum]
MTLFFYGTLRHPPLLAAVLGRDPGPLPAARLPGHEVRWVAGHHIPMIVEGGAGADGVVYAPSSGERARLDAYEAGFAFGTRTVEVTAAGGPVRAEVYWPDTARFVPGAPFVLADWAARWGGTAPEAAAEFLCRLERGEPAEDARRFFPAMEARAWARQLARAHPGRADLRQPGNPVEVLKEHEGFHGFFRFRHLDLRHRPFAGDWTPPFTRECYIGFDAALVLPYDPATDEVLLIEQLRLAASLRGDPNPMCLEPVAGLIEGGESPEDTARREAREEAGIEVGELIPVLRSYPSPGYSTEFHHAFVGLADLAGAHMRRGGAEGEMEDIRSHVLPLDAAVALIGTGELTATPVAMLLLWLARERDRGRFAR